VRRVLRLAIPSGVVIGTATIVTYLMARADPTATPIQQSTAAVVTLYLIATWVLVVVARPFAWWKAGMIAASLAAFSYALFLPWIFGQQFWQLDPSHTGIMVPALVVAAVAAVVIEVAYRLVNRSLART
jgi:cation-transporting ATPase E